MIVDYHTHTKLCKHAQGEAEEYVLKALELRLDEVGCSDHAPLPGNFDDRHRMTAEEYTSVYSPAVSGLVEKYQKKIRIKRGIECDFLERASDWNRKFIAENDFDFVIGSVHFVGSAVEELPLFGREYGDSELATLYEGYYRALSASAESGFFDIIGHCDLIKKFGAFSSRAVDELIWEALTRIKKADLCIEVNTSGLWKPEKETYPSERMLAHARDLKIPLTLGSDAHNPEDVGKYFDRAVDLIERYGNGRISLFEKRKRSEVRVSRLHNRR